MLQLQNFNLHFRSNEFQCLSGECIANSKLCDGTNDCKDESDEDQDICAEFPCPENTYHCKHGGCIHLDARCNGFQDCVDGSDESNILCKSLKCKGNECDKGKGICIWQSLSQKKYF